MPAYGRSMSADQPNKPRGAGQRGWDPDFARSIMKLFWAIVAAFGLIVLAKAGTYPLVEIVWAGQPFHFSSRLLLPLELFSLGYFIFVLEGVQSSIMLANKQSTEALERALGKIDIAKRLNAKATAVLRPYADHQPIDAFVVGRQIIIIACALLFKSAYDAASLTEYESSELARFAGAHPTAVKIAALTHEILDNRWFSFFVCSVAVAFVFQVTAKVMAQNYPMRFLIMMVGALSIPAVARLVGRLSLLAHLLSAMRSAGAVRARNGRHSYYHDKEPTQTGTEQMFDALSSDSGEALEEISIEVSQDHANSHSWIVHVRIVQRVIEPGQLFANFLDSLAYEALEFSAAAFVGKDKDRTELRAQRSQINVSKIVEANGSVKQIQSRLFARFGRVVPTDGHVVWDIKLTMPVRTHGDGLESPVEYWFEQLIRKPVRRINFYVEEGWSTDPTVHISSLDGVATPRLGKTQLAHPNGRRHLQIDYPSINSRLRFMF